VNRSSVTEIAAIAVCTAAGISAQPFRKSTIIVRIIVRIPSIAAGASHEATFDLAIHPTTENTTRLAEQFPAVRDAAKSVFGRQGISPNQTPGAD
jgi:hypothetical protein